MNFHGLQVYEILLRANRAKTVPPAQLHGTRAPQVLLLAHGSLRE